jgi:hypothetical protein
MISGEHWLFANTPPRGASTMLSHWWIMTNRTTSMAAYRINAVWYGPSTIRDDQDWQSSGDLFFKNLWWVVDGMQVQLDIRDNATTYAGIPIWFLQPAEQKIQELIEKSVEPYHELGEKPLRFNWQIAYFIKHFIMRYLLYWLPIVYIAL